MKLLLYLTLFAGVLAGQVPNPTVDEHAKEKIDLAAELEKPEPVTEPEAPVAVTHQVESALPAQSTTEELSRRTGELPLLGLIGLLAMTSVLFLGKFQA